MRNRALPFYPGREGRYNTPNDISLSLNSSRSLLTFTIIYSRKWAIFALPLPNKYKGKLK